MSSEKIIPVVTSDMKVINVDSDASTSTVVIPPVIPPVDKTSKDKGKDKKADKKSKTNKKGAKEDGKTSKDASIKDDGEKKKSKFSVPKKESNKDNNEPSVRDIMFPAKFTVHGVTFTRIEDSDIEKANKKLKDSGEKIETIIDYVSYLFNKDKAVMIGANWEEEMLNPKGKRKTSEYQISTGLVPPSKFPANIEMCLIDVILNIQMEAFVSHSVYTEYPGTSAFEVFEKRDKKNGYFVSEGGVPLELYVADYSKADDNVIGSYINLYEDDKDESTEG